MDYAIKTHYQRPQPAEGYDATFRRSLRARLTDWGERQAFLRLLDRVPANATVLDVACGTGRFLGLLLQRGYRAVGLDISAPMLAVAQRRLAGHPRPLSLQRGDAECLPFETGRFDGVTCMRLYQRVPADVRVQMLREVRRVGNGWAIVSFAMSSRWLDVRRTIRSRVLSSRSIVPHPVTFQELEQDLRAAGLRLEAQTWVLPGLAEGKVLLVTW